MYKPFDPAVYEPESSAVMMWYVPSNAKLFNTAVSRLPKRDTLVTWYIPSKALSFDIVVQTSQALEVLTRCDTQDPRRSGLSNA